MLSTALGRAKDTSLLAAFNPAPPFPVIYFKLISSLFIQCFPCFFAIQAFYDDPNNVMPATTHTSARWTAITYSSLLRKPNAPQIFCTPDVTAVALCHLFEPPAAETSRPEAPEQSEVSSAAAGSLPNVTSAPPSTSSNCIPPVGKPNEPDPKGLPQISSTQQAEVPVRNVMLAYLDEWKSKFYQVGSARDTRRLLSVEISPITHKTAACGWVFVLGGRRGNTMCIAQHNTH